MTSRSARRCGSSAVLVLTALSLTLPALPTQAADAGGPSLVAPRFGTWGVDLAGRDLKVRPGDDFYRYANGLWDKATTLPPDRVRYGNFDKLSELSETRTKAIIDEAAAGRLKDPDAAPVGEAYRAFMDEALIERLDAQPLAPALAEIKAVSTKDQFTALMGRSNVSPYMGIFGANIDADQKAPDRYTVYLSTDGLGLPDRDYYLQPSFAEKKAAYQTYIAKMLEMVGWSDPAGSAQAIVAFETKLADASWTRAEQRDPDKTYKPKSLAELSALAPTFDWTLFLKGTELPAMDHYVVTTDTAFPKFAAIYAETPLETLKAWEAFHVADQGAPTLSKRLYDVYFDFHGKTLLGQAEQRPRWRRAVTQVNDMMGEAVGRLYVARYFNAAAKAKMDALVANLQTALRGRLQNLTWMNPQTKAQAVRKLSQFTVKIGYPVRWRDYSKLTIRADDPYGNRIRAGAFEWRRQVARINSPVDRQEWAMTPQTVNAYYNPTANEIVFPAAILQPPFFDLRADSAVNYGAIGAVIGHEISHGFDDEGRHYDGTGSLRDWWSAEDAQKFETQAAKLGAQYSAFEPLPGAHINGQLTMGENIADMAGLLIALDAYHASLGGRPAPVIDGLTGDQRVFLAFAQVYRTKRRDDYLRQSLVSDPHSPDYYRVDGVVRNVDAWYAAFGVKPGDKLYVPPEQRVRLW